jgi:hypothetical protein
MVLRVQLAVLLAIGSATVGLTSPARASLGYELDASNPVRTLAGAPRGLAIDQDSEDIYVAIVSTNPGTGTPGRIDRYDSDLDADGVFAQGDGYYTGVAVNPNTQGFYGTQTEVDTAFGAFGTPSLDQFSSSGAALWSVEMSDTIGMPPIATDSAGRIFYPYAAGHSVQVFNSAGVLQEEITCADCPGGPFGKPVSVALNDDDDLYVADLAPDRAVKLSPSGGSYSFAALLQSGRGAAAVGVDPETDDVLVGDMPGGRDYHIVAYDSSGTQFDDFGAGMFGDPPADIGAFGAPQMAVNETTHKLYVGEFGKFYVFEKTTIDPPTAVIEPAAAGQITAILNSTVNASGHAALNCEFEITDDADFQVNGFTNATSLSCPKPPDGSGDTAVEAKISGLQPVTTYHFRLTVTTNGGSVTSDAETFETLPVVPATVTTELPDGVTQKSVRLKGNVNPRGGEISECRFEYGTSVSYGSNIDCAALPGAVTTEVAQARKVLGLTPGTTYHYRLIVSGNAGTVVGKDVEFTTTTATQPPEPEPEPEPESPAPPPSVAPPPSPAPIVASHPMLCGKAFRKRKVQGKVRCVPICKKSFRAILAHGKVKCVKRPRGRRAGPPRPARAGRR